MFENDDFPYWYNECRPNRQWAEPDEIVPCKSKILNYWNKSTSKFFKVEIVVYTFMKTTLLTYLVKFEF